MGLSHEKSLATEGVYIRGAGINTDNRVVQIIEKLAPSYNKHKSTFVCKKYISHDIFGIDFSNDGNFINNRAFNFVPNISISHFPVVSHQIRMPYF